MDIILSENEVRVLGCLIEKEMTTPEYYPLSLNALINACNQKTNRYPVVSYDDPTVHQALEILREKQLVFVSTMARVPRYGQNVSRLRKFVNKEMAILGVLMLRGPQTVGEIRGRTDRMYNFISLAEVEETLQFLDELGFVRQLPRQPGQKEVRYTHLLSGEPKSSDQENFQRPDPFMMAEDPSGRNRIAQLEDDVAQLRQDLQELRQSFADFKQQFE